MEFNVQFPDPGNADDDGLLAVGGELTPNYLVSAYAQGVFPWFNDDSEILWWSPNPRLVLIPNEFKFRKSLRQVVNSGKYSLKIDHDFSSVIQNCSGIFRKDQDGTWITGSMIEAYKELFKLGVAHSFEIYSDDKLVGGLYGISLGRAFFGESMFHLESNVSKIALYYLVEWCKKNEFLFIDAQQSTSHMRSLGAKEIERTDFLKLLDNALDNESKVGRWSF